MPNGSSPYVNPIPNSLTPERIDQGVDFGGNGPIKAIGDAQIIAADAHNSGWPGGGWLVYKLTSGAAAGKMVYVAEDIRPTVRAGQSVKAGQVIANLHTAGSGMETGWAASANQPLSQTAAAGSIGGGNLPGGGQNPTAVGKNFDELLVALGAKKAPNFGRPVGGKLPPGYPDWSNTNLNVDNSAGGSPSSSSSGGGITSDIFGGIAGDIANPILSSLGVSSIGDFFERAGLILVGMILILIGIWKMGFGGSKSSSQQGRNLFGEDEGLGDPGDEETSEPEISAPETEQLSVASKPDKPKPKVNQVTGQTIGEFGKNGPQVEELEEVPF